MKRARLCLSGITLIVTGFVCPALLNYSLVQAGILVIFGFVLVALALFDAEELGFLSDLAESVKIFLFGY